VAPFATSRLPGDFFTAEAKSQRYISSNAEAAEKDAEIAEKDPSRLKYVRSSHVSSGFLHIAMPFMAWFDRAICLL